MYLFSVLRAGRSLREHSREEPVLTANTTSKNTTRKKQILSVLLLIGGNFLLLLTLWLFQKYDKIVIDQFLFQLKTTSEGVDFSLVWSFVLRVCLPTAALTLFDLFAYRFLSGRMTNLGADHARYRTYKGSKPCAFFAKRMLSLSFAVFLMGVIALVAVLRIPSYLDTATTESDFIEDHYVDPRSVSVIFPETKRNLVYIFLESMESTFADPTAGGSIRENYISELSALAEENISFSHTQGMGGAQSFSGTTWTAAAMVSQTSGIPMKVKLGADAYGSDEVFMPGIVSLGEILQKEGYNQLLLLGSDAEFHGRELYFLQNGNYEILDTEALKAAGRLPEDYREWWGYEDEKLFAYAKEELTRLASEGRPFNFTMLTADTHFPDGYLCRLCGNEHEEQYANVLSCSSKQVYAFVSWLKEQPFYENTTVIISGDHLTMDGAFLKDTDENYTRTIYNCILNAPLQPIREKERSFATFDLFPTTLAALGVTVEGDRLALGTNLFSDQETLAEQYGSAVLDEELKKNSEYYNARFLGMETETADSAK